MINKIVVIISKKASQLVIADNIYPSPDSTAQLNLVPDDTIVIKLV